MNGKHWSSMRRVHKTHGHEQFFHMDPHLFGLHWKVSHKNLFPRRTPSLLLLFNLVLRSFCPTILGTPLLAIIFVSLWALLGADSWLLIPRDPGVYTQNDLRNPLQIPQGYGPSTVGLIENHAIFESPSVTGINSYTSTYLRPGLKNQFATT